MTTDEGQRPNIIQEAFNVYMNKFEIAVSHFFFIYFVLIVSQRFI